MMSNVLESIDHSITIAVNGANSPMLDEIMWMISGKLTWIPLIILLLYFVYKKSGKSGIIYCSIGLGMCILVADLSSVHLFKNVFERFRPSHNLLLSDQLHYHQYDNGGFYKGGQFGFVSSHMANFVSMGTFIYLFAKGKFKFIWAPIVFVCVLTGYSRIYLGVHYFSDVICGGILGILLGYLVYKLIANFAHNKTA